MMKYNITPSKRLTDLLSTYLEFDEEKLKLGLWSGDLNIKDVNLKNEAFSTLLNTWKGRGGTRTRTGTHKSKESEGPTATRGTSTYHDIDLASFLTKEALMGEEPSAASTLNLKLLEGKIGNFRAQVPWKQLVIGASDSTVHLELNNITIRLSLESCIAQALALNHDHNKDGGIGGRSRLRDYFCGKDVSEQPKQQRLKGEESRWKQEMIRIAEQCVKDGQDIPTPEEFLLKRSEFFSDNNINAPESEEEFKNAAEERTATLLERFVKSFASSLGWRVGRGLQAKLSNIQIVIEEGGIEIGLLSESIELYEFSHEDEDAHTKDPHIENDVSASDANPEGENMPHHSFSLEERKESIISERESIRKKLLISNCGVFLRPANLRRLVQPTLDEYIIHPTNASVTMCLRPQSEDGDPSVEMNLETEMKNSEEFDELDSVEVIAPQQKKRRRGKREKRQKVDDSEDSTIVDRQEGPKEEMVGGKFDEHDASTLKPTESEVEVVGQNADENDLASQNSQKNVAQHDAEKEFDKYDSFTSSIESSALVMTKIQMERIIFVPTSISIEMMNDFLTSVTILKGGRPCSLGSFDRGGTIGNLEYERLRNRCISFSFLRGLRRRAMLLNFLSGKGERFNPSAARRFQNEYIETYRRICQDDGLFRSYGEYRADRISATYTDIESLRIMEDALPVEQIILYRKMAKSNASARNRKVYIGDQLDMGRVERFMPNHLTLQKKVSFGSDADELSLPSQSRGILKMRSGPIMSSDSATRPRHRLTRSFGFSMNDMERKKIPKHVRRQTLNIDTMNQALGHISTPRHRRRSTDLGSIIEDKSFDEGSVMFRDSLLETRRQFDSLIQKDSQLLKSLRTDERDAFKSDGSSSAPIVSITSSISVKIGCVKFFLCQETKPVDDDSVSILTTNSFETTRYNIEEICVSSDRDDYNEGLFFSGKSHKVLLSGALRRVKCFSNTEVDQKVKNMAFSIDGATCFLLGTNIFNSGRIRPASIPNNFEIESVSLLPSFIIHEDIHSGVPFVSAELTSVSEDAQINSVNLRLHVGYVKVTVDFCNFGELKTFVQRCPSRHGGDCVSVSRFDMARWEGVKLLTKKASAEKSINVFAKFGGLQLDLSVPSNSEPDCHLEGSKVFRSLICCRIQSMILRQNRLLDEKGSADSSLQVILGDFPPDKFTNTLLTFVGLECYFGNDNFFDEPLHGEVLYSQCRDTIANKRSNKSLVLLVSPISISLSTSMIQILTSACNALQKQTVGETVDEEDERGKINHSPRISMLADLCHTRVQVLLQSFYVGLESEMYPFKNEEAASHLPLFTVTIREIISDLLSLIVCFPPPFESHAASEGKIIAAGRLVALGLSHEEARHYVEFAVENCNERICSLELDERTRLQEGIAFDTVGFSPRKNKPVFDESNVDDILANLCSRIVEDTIKHVSSKRTIELKTANWSKSLIVSMPSGIRLEAEQYHYDWRITGRIDSFELKNGGGVSLLTVVSKPHATEGDFQFPNPDQGTTYGAFFTLLQKDDYWDFGTGGISLSDFADDNTTEEASNRKLMQEINASFGLLKLLFSDKDATNAMESITLLFDNLNADSDFNSTTSTNITPAKPPIESVSTSFDISNAQLLLCSDELQPFSKIVLGNVSADTVSSTALTQSRKKLLISATADTFDIFNLTPEGQCFSEFVSNRMFREEATECPIQITMTISSDTVKNPSELLIVLNKVQIIFLRRFLNELSQFFGSPDYGVGHFISVHSRNSDICQEDLTPHPLNYQVYLIDSTIILPKSSESDELIALKTSKAVLSNSYEKQSWSDPVVCESKTKVNDSSYDDLMEFHQTFSQSDTFSGENEANFGFCDLQSDSLVFDSSVVDATPPFDKDTIMRITVSAEDVELFTGISIEKHKNENCSKDLFYLMRFIDIGKVDDGLFVFKSMRNLPGELFLKRKLLNELLSRKWENILSQPIQLEVYCDFVPSNLRLLIKDRIAYENGAEEKCPLDAKLRMSAFYLLLSWWYGNMQELPIMFPYDPMLVLNLVDVPSCPKTWPEYGTEEYVNLLRNGGNESMEIAVSFSQVKWLCLFDHPEYFSKELGCSFMLDSRPENIRLESDNLTIKVVFTRDRVMKLSCGAKTVRIYDLRRAKTIFEKALIVPNDNADTMKAEEFNKCVDMSWGLERDMRSFNQNLDFPFQLSLFMTPDRWCLVNVGICKGDSSSRDLAFFWMMLEYFSAYFQHAEFGNPYFHAEKDKEKILKYYGKWKEPDSEEMEQNCLNLDIRLWLEQPNIVIPSNALDPESQLLALKSRCGGLFYRYKTIGYGYYTQEIIARNMEMLVLTESSFISMNHLRDIKNSGRSARFLVERLDLDVNYETHIKANHVNVSLSIPTVDSSESDLCGIESSSLQVDPLCLPAPVVCKTRFRPSRHMHSRTCDITVSPENMKLATDLLYNFVGPFKAEEKTNPDSNGEDGIGESENGLSFSVAANLSRTRLVICEPILGKHLPIAVVCISDLVSGISRLNFGDNNVPGGADFQASVDTKLWIDYYKNGPTRSWEPFLEPYKCTILYEKSMKRGQGISFNSDCPLHVNISGAFLETLDFATGSLFNSIFKVLGKAGDINPSLSNEGEDIRVGSPKACRGTSMMREEVTCTDGERVQVIHEHVSTLTSQDRVAFSLINMTGQQIRFHQQRMHELELRVHYLDHLDVTALAFPATHSIFRNLKVVEVSSEAFEDSIFSGDQVDCSHFVDVQVPGMHWTRGISVDVTGKRFINLKPRSELVLNKIQNDWKLANALTLLVDVSFFEGGRQVTLTSPVEIINKTCHKVQLAIHSDPTHITQNKRRRKHSEREGNSNDEDFDVSSFECQVEEMIPGESYHIPFLLLDAALTSEGCNLGSFWLRPHEQDENNFLTSFHDFSHSSNSSIGFCSKPIQISHMVDDSSELFQNPSNSAQQDQNELSTGYQLSCPIIEHNEESISPFCYCVEVKRSPLVAPFSGHGLNDSKSEPSETHPRKNSAQGSMTSTPHFQIDDQSVQSSLKKGSSTFKHASHEDFDLGTDFQSSVRHGPVAYSLVIHPPIVIENLLPEPARYELMHATRNHVVWWSNLEPGESVPVHTVGLDSPLKLLINVGYCRTLVGEGAVVHHGSGNRNRYNQQSGGWTDVPKVAVKKADKVINAISHIAHSKEARATAKIEEAKFSESADKRDSERAISSSNQKKPDTNAEKEGTSNHAKEYGERVKDHHDNILILNELAREMSVVDSVGQRLTLRIDNKEGGGGQRHITVSCPYWIINTTEHALRYKQEKKSALVSGSMASASKDGSKPVDYSKRRSNISEECGKGTIFPGKPGALARIKQDIDLYGYTSLLNKEIPLDLMAKMAFMFNYCEYHPFGAQERMSIQLVDPLWRSSRCSEWSPGFSLQSVGVSQIVGMHCLDGRQLEVAVIVQVAPGKLSNYTKIVRICPRYVLVNQLQHPIRLWQDSSLVHPSKVLDDSKNITHHEREVPNWRYKSQREEISDVVLSKYDFLFGSPSILDIEPDVGMPLGTLAHKSALYITTALSNRLYPFHLPNTRVDRELRVDFGPNWNLSASFPADTTGEYALKLTRVVDLRILKHVDNRGAPRYKVKLPPPDSIYEDMDHWDGELGIWFETVQWNNRRKIIVKGAKRGKFSYNNTDIHVGDELIAIDGRYVLDMTFAETMVLIKRRLSEVSDVYKMRKYRSIKQSKKPRFLKRFDRMSSKGEVDPSSLPVDETETQGDTLTLTFQTLEYRMKRVRDKALKRKKFRRTLHPDREQNDIATAPSLRTIDSPQRVNRQDSRNQQPHNEIRERQINVSLKLLNQSLFVFLNELKQSAPYRIENRCIRHIIYFRQRFCENYPWNALAPGESINYAWEEPMKPNKLIVRVGNQNTLSYRERAGMKLLPFKLIETEDQGGFGASKAVKLDEVGFHDILPCPSNSSTTFEDDKARENTHLYCSVDTDGATRVLVVSDADTLDSNEELAMMEKHRATLTRQILEESAKLHLLKQARVLQEEEVKQKNSSLSPSLPTVQEEEFSLPALNSTLNVQPPVDTDTNTTKSPGQIISEDELISLADREENNIIRHTHQLIVEVVEATGLQASNHSDVHSFCNPYCSVRVEDRSRKMRPNLFINTDNVKRTYFIERTSSPKWSGMNFVFDVPHRAAEDPTGFAVSVKVKDFRIVGRNRPLGRTEIHLRSLRTQKEVTGWFPLLPKTARGNEFLNPAVAGRARGSVKLRIHWVYTVPALLDYYILLSEKNVAELEGNRNGINEQSERLYETERARKRNAESAAFSNIPLLTNTIKRGIDGRGNSERTRSSEGNWASSIKQNMRSNKLRQLWTRQRHENTVDAIPPEIVSESSNFLDDIEGYQNDNKLDITTSFDDVDSVYRSTRNSKQPYLKVSESGFEDTFFPFSPTIVPQRGPTFSEGNILKQNRRGLSDLAHDQQCDILPEVPFHFEGKKDSLVNDLYASRILYHQAGKTFYQQHMQNTIFTFGGVVSHGSPATNIITSWVSAYTYFNDPDTLPYYISTVKRRKKQFFASKGKATFANEPVYPEIALPSRAPSIVRERNIQYQTKLCSSRVLFDKAAQRSLTAVLNPGGWLKLRPITALSLPQGYTGMYIKVRYGSESCSTPTVDSKITPTWTNESNLSGETSNLESGQSSLEGDFFTRREHDLEVKVERLKTSGSLQLSVVGTRLNTKVELGVLQIPLANAISCCTEASVSQGNDTMVPGIYIRWYPLVDPKSVSGDDLESHQPMHVEETSDEFFSQYYMPCIKLAMWWEPDEPLDFSNSPDDKDEVQSTTVEETALMSETYFQSSFDTISAALIDSFKAQELLSMSTTDIDVRYSMNKSITQVCVTMGYLQVDHHAKRALEPVVLCPTPVSNPQPTVQLLAIKDNARSKSNFDSFKHIAIALEEMDLRIEEIWMFDIWELFYRVLRRHNAMKKSLMKNATGRKKKQSPSGLRVKHSGFADSDNNEVINDVMNIIKSTFENACGNNQKEHSKQIYIEKLFLGSVKFNVSYIKSLRSNRSREQYKKNRGPQRNRRSNVTNSTASSYDCVEIFRRWSELGHDEDWSSTVDQRAHNFPNIISAVFPAIKDAPIRVNAKVIENVFEPFGEIFDNLKHFYLKEMLYQVYKILGSVEIFGNPVMVVNSFMKGAHDFVVLPFREFLRSPNDPSKFGIGVAKGTLSLISQTFSGIFGFISSISEAGGSAAAALSFDEQFKRWHNQQVTDHVRHMHGQFRPKGCQLVASAVTRPVQDLVAGLLFAVSGVFVEPYKGAQMRGMPGFTKGVGIGTVGLVTKPLVGVCDALAHMSESVQDVARGVNVLDKRLPPVKKRRLPYVFGMQKILVSYNSVSACSSYLLHLFPMKDDKRSEYKGNEILVLSEKLQLEPGVGMYIVVSTKRIVLFVLRYDKSEPPVKRWEIQLCSSVQLSSSVDNYLHNGVVLRITSIPQHSLRLSSPTSKAVSSGNDNESSHDNSFVKGFDSNHLRKLDVAPSRIEEAMIRKESTKTNPVQNVFGAFAGVKSKKKDKVTYAVYGEFQHRAELTRVHNAICCLTGQFDSIFYSNGAGVPGNTEGYTSFGPLHFVEEEVEPTLPDISKQARLDTIPWIHNFQPEEVRRRKAWVYADELKQTSEQSDPQWVREARARAFFYPLPLPPVPSPLNENAPEVQEVAYDLRNGFISHTKASELLHELAKQATVHSTVRTEDTNFETLDNSINRLNVIFDGEDGVSPIVPSNGNIEERLENVEFMLQRLLYNQSSAPGVSTISSNLPTNSQQISPRRQGSSVVSALTGPGDHHLLGQPLAIQPTLLTENERLKKEVQFLRQQLHATEIANSVGDGSNTTGTVTDKPKRKKRFKRPWKA